MLSRFRKGLARLLARQRLAILLLVLAASAASGVADDPPPTSRQTATHHPESPVQRDAPAATAIPAIRGSRTRPESLTPGIGHARTAWAHRLYFWKAGARAGF